MNYCAYLCIRFQTGRLFLNWQPILKIAVFLNGGQRNVSLIKKIEVELLGHRLHHIMRIYFIHYL